MTALELLVTEHSNVCYRHAARAARKPGCRAALVFNLDCVGLTEKEVQTMCRRILKQLLRM